MDYRIIKSPSVGTRNMLKRRSDSFYHDMIMDVDAIGLLQGKLIEMAYATDIAEKESGVSVADIRGNCPQNMIMIAILGDTSAVEAAVARIKEISERGQ